MSNRSGSQITPQASVSVAMDCANWGCLRDASHELGWVCTCGSSSLIVHVNLAKHLIKDQRETTSSPRNVYHSTLRLLFWCRHGLIPTSTKKIEIPQFATPLFPPSVMKTTALTPTQYILLPRLSNPRKVDHIVVAEQTQSRGNTATYANTSLHP